MANNHFPNDGRNDRKARASERDLCEWLNIDANRKMIYPDLNDNVYARHVGGSNGKDDVTIVERNTTKVLKDISIKHKKFINKGTFDWTNDSSWTSQQVEHNPAFYPIRKIFDLRNELIEQGSTNKVSIIRPKVSDAASTVLDNLSDKHIRTVLQDLMISKCDKQDIFVFVPPANKIYFFSFTKHSINTLIKQQGEFFLRAKTVRSKGSRAVFFRDKNGREIDTGLRFRLHLNNGVSAWMGAGDKCKYSTWCFKIQQDSRDEVISISEVYDYK